MGSGQPTSSNTVYQTQASRPDSWVTQSAMGLSNQAQRAANLPASSYPWIPTYHPQIGATGGYENVFTGEGMNELEVRNGILQYKRPPFQSLIAPQPTETTQGLERLVNRAQGGSPILNAAQTNLSDTLSGKYLTADSNPYLSGMYDAGARQVMQNYNESVQPQTNAMFNRAGAFGGSAHRLFQGAQARDTQQTLADLANTMYGNQYQQERQKQLQAALVGPQIAQSDYYDIQALLSAGDIKRGEEQSKQNELLNYYSNIAGWPYQQAQFQAGIIPQTFAGGGTTGYSSSTGSQANPYYVNPASKAMGGIASGIGTGAMLGMATGNPLIGAAGGLAGLLTGLF